ncbi:MAG TPA: hypothetical protein VKT49_06250, partial [Bryobacteraceae bacterium]|nr:hypothetical protein [Bryobacteraceae bacterium]
MKVRLQTVNRKRWKQRQALSARLLQPLLPLCSRELDALLSQILTAYFPEQTVAPPIYFGRTATLAYIEDVASGRCAIWMHYALNDPATPDYVFAHVLKHELLHTRIRPREENGVWLDHPREFWEEERRISEDDRGRACKW